MMLTYKKASQHMKDSECNKLRAVSIIFIQKGLLNSLVQCILLDMLCSVCNANSVVFFCLFVCFVLFCFAFSFFFFFFFRVKLWHVVRAILPFGIFYTFGFFYNCVFYHCCHYVCWVKFIFLFLFVCLFVCFALLCCVFVFYHFNF